MSQKRKREGDFEEIPHKKNRTEAFCPICIDYENKEPFEILSCSHSFHPSCISPWLKKSRRCPVCRSVVRKKTAQEILSNLDDWFSESEDDYEDEENTFNEPNTVAEMQASEDEDYLTDESSSESGMEETEEEESSSSESDTDVSSSESGMEEAEEEESSSSELDTTENNLVYFAKNFGEFFRHRFW